MRSEGVFYLWLMREFGDQILDKLIDGKSANRPVSACGPIGTLIQTHIEERNKPYCLRMIQDADVAKVLRRDCLRVIFNIPTNLD